MARCAADPVDEPARLASADRYFERVAASVVYGGDLACYVPAADIIRLPELARFDRPADFYSTSAHEHVHWTGHRSRLDRDLSGRFGDRAYGAEELIAELGAAFWCAQFQLEQATRADHAAYLGDWLSAPPPGRPGPGRRLRPGPAGDRLPEHRRRLAVPHRRGTLPRRRVSASRRWPKRPG